MLKIPTTIVLAMLASACTSLPLGQGAAAPVASTPATSVTATAAAQSAKHLLSGFTLVLKSGVATYCRQDLKTGSHIVVQERCLSQREYDSLEEDTRRDVDRIRRTISPATGTSGGNSH